MEVDILQQLKDRPGVNGKEELLKELISDCVEELKDYLNYSTEDDLPIECKTLVKKMVLVYFNQSGAEGVLSENNSGVSTTYLSDLPPGLLKRIKRYRKLRR